MDEIRHLPTKLATIGIEKRFALDVGSVVSGLRARGLLHVPCEQVENLRQLISACGLVIEAERELQRVKDPETREGILVERQRRASCSDQWWNEIWFRSATSAAIPADVLWRETGSILGYPNCCTRFMEGQRSLSQHYNRYCFDPGGGRHWIINRLSSLFSQNLIMLELFPCSLSCDHARDFAKPFVNLARDIFQADIFEAARKCAMRPYVRLRDHLVAFDEWECFPEMIRVNLDTATKVPLSDLGIHNYRKDIEIEILAFAHLQEATGVPNGIIRLQLQPQEGAPSELSIPWC